MSTGSDTCSIDRLSYEDAKVFIQQLTKDTNCTMRKLNAGEKITFRLVEPNPSIGKYKYAEIVNGHLVGYITIAAGLDGRPRIVSSYHVSRKSIGELNLPSTKPKITKSEKRWTQR